MEHQKLLENTFIVLTADHGETLGDYNLGDFGHGESLRPELIQIPLLLMGPGITPGRTSCIGQSSDLANTLLQMAELPPMSGDGQDLRTQCRSFARHFLYQTDKFSFLAVHSETTELSWDCQKRLLESYDLTTSPPLWVQNPPSPDPELLQNLQNLISDVNATMPESSCPMP